MSVTAPVKQEQSSSTSTLEALSGAGAGALSVFAVVVVVVFDVMSWSSTTVSSVEGDKFVSSPPLGVVLEECEGDDGVCIFFFLLSSSSSSLYF